MRILVCGDRDWNDFAFMNKHIMAVVEQPNAGYEYRAELQQMEDACKHPEKHNPEHSHYKECFPSGLSKTKVTIIEGDARGADTQAGEIAWLHNFDLKIYPADWNKHGKAAGPIRNQQMLDEGKPDIVLAFHDDIENSKGTKDMVKRATKAGIPVQVIKHEQ